MEWEGKVMINSLFRVVLQSLPRVGSWDPQKMYILFIVVMHLAVQALSVASLGYATETKGANISNKRYIVKNPNWLKADQLAIYKAWPRIWTQDYRKTNPVSGSGIITP